MHLLLLGCVGVVSLAFWPKSQEPAAVDWTAAVDKACTASRYGLRLAAAKQVAAGGGAAVPALRAFAQQKGLDQVASSLVDAIADAEPADAPLLDLLFEWAGNRDFYWRAAAMRGLALRAPKLAEPTRKTLQALFVPAYDDPAWLSRTHARLGGLLLGDTNVLSLTEVDPRARVRLAALLLRHGKDTTATANPTDGRRVDRTLLVGTLLDALALDGTFLGDGWAARTASEARAALKAWLGPDDPGSFDGDRDKGLRTLTALCETKTGRPQKLPVAATARSAPIAGGIELLSCKHGDLHLQWTADGLVQVGVDASRDVTIPAATWAALWNDRTALQLRDNLGVVICDSLRVCWLTPESNVKIAPLALPLPAVNWLKQLAAAIEEAGQPRLAADLRSGLDQFAAR